MSALGAGATLCDGRYRLESVLGRGGMAVVWKATDSQLERPVAIKVISDVLATDPSFVARFEREARLAAGLAHPNLVKVFDYSIDSERPFLIMEYIPGGTLAQVPAGALDTEQLARELLDAVAHIHNAGILHRDIKPANVLLGGDGSARLTDFGIARADETSSLTLTGQVMGTLRYIAPEVAAGEPATPRSDLYSLGVVLGEAADESVSPELGRLIERLSARDPGLRPASAADALAELDPTRALPRTQPHEPEELAPTQPLSAERATAAPPPARRSLPAFRIQRSHAIAAALALVALLLIVIVAASSGGNSNKVDAGNFKQRQQLRPAPAGAPADAQITQLEKLVRAAPRAR